MKTGLKGVERNKSRWGGKNLREDSKKDFFWKMKNSTKNQWWKKDKGSENNYEL